MRYTHNIFIIENGSSRSKLRKKFTYMFATETSQCPRQSVSDWVRSNNPYLIKDNTAASPTKAARAACKKMTANQVGKYFC